jgi:type IV pilus assembly protein PilE
MGRADTTRRFELAEDSIRRNRGGFTLLELLITLAIVAIIAAVAVPAYNQRVAEARQTGARRNLMSLAQMQEMYRFQNGTYTAAMDDLRTLGWTNDTGNPGDVGRYEFSITASSATAFTIQAAGDIGTGVEDRWTVDEQGAINPG